MRSRRSARRSAPSRRSRRTSPSAASSATGTTGSPTAASRTSSSATSASGTLPRRASPGPGCGCGRGTRTRRNTTSRRTAARSRSPSTPATSRGCMARADLVVLDLASRRWQNLTADSGMSDEHPRYSPDGRHIAYHAYDTQRAFNDQGHLRLLDRRTRAWSRLAPALDRADGAAARGRDDGDVAAASCARTAAASASTGCELGAEAPTQVAAGGTHRRLRVLERRRGAGLRPLDDDAPLAALRRARRRQRRASDRAPERGAARAARAGRGARVHRQGLEGGAGAGVRDLPARLRPVAPLADDALDPRRPARRAPRRLALPLEHAGLRGHRPRRRLRELPRLLRLRPGVPRDDHRALRREGAGRPRGRHRLHARAGLHRSPTGSPRPAAAMAASWWRS